jgi:preprotein translocase SecE subunit
MFAFFKNILAEFSKMKIPTLKESGVMLLSVSSFLLISVIVFMLADYVFSLLLKSLYV